MARSTSRRCAPSRSLPTGPTAPTKVRRLPPLSLASFAPSHPFLAQLTATHDPPPPPENSAALPTLNEAQLHKLRQLTLVSLARQREVRVGLRAQGRLLPWPNSSTHTRTTYQSVPYALLFEELGLGAGEDKVRELEDLVIETIYMVRE